MRQTSLCFGPRRRLPLLVAWLSAVGPAILAEESRGDGDAEGVGPPVVEWRVVNAEEVEVAWRIRSIQFYGDDACTTPLHAEPNHTGTAFASDASEMTGAAYAFALRSPRGWESEDACAPGQCHLGFSWSKEVADVRCILVAQGETGFHAGAITLQSRRPEAGSEWAEMATWRPVEPGKAKLAMSCPTAPSIRNGKVSDCHLDNERSGACTVQCDEGYGTVEPLLHCIHGAWYLPECLAIGSIIRVVAREPEIIKPYWVVLDAALYASSDCTDVLRMDGLAVSSGEYVIKYANYHPKNAWDGDASTSWASSEPCTPGSCYFGFRFRELLSMPVRCVRVEHPQGQQYQASKISVEVLGKSGWEELPDVAVQLLPEVNQEL